MNRYVTRTGKHQAAFQDACLLLKREPTNERVQVFSLVLSIYYKYYANMEIPVLNKTELCDRIKNEELQLYALILLFNTSKNVETKERALEKTLDYVLLDNT